MVITMGGNLGTGKTTLATGLTAALGTVRGGECVPRQTRWERLRKK